MEYVLSTRSVKEAFGEYFGTSGAAEDLWKNFSKYLYNKATAVPKTWSSSQENKLNEAIVCGDFNMRLQNIFQMKGIKYYYQLVQLSQADLLRTKNLGRYSLSEIEKALEKRGLELQMNLAGFTPKSKEKQNELHAGHGETVGADSSPI